MRESDIQFDADIKQGNIVSARVGYLGHDIDFDIAKSLLESHGYEIISLEENAGLRIRNGGNLDTMGGLDANLVREALIYVPKKGLYITRNSPIMENPGEAIRAHLMKTEFFLTDERVDKTLENSVELSQKRLDGNRIAIPTIEFGKEPVTHFIFGKNAPEYAQLINEHHVKQGSASWIKEVSMDIELKKGWEDAKKPFAIPIRLGDLAGYSYSPLWGNFGPGGITRGIRYDGQTGLPPRDVFVQRELEFFKLLMEREK